MFLLLSVQFPHDVYYLIFNKGKQDIFYLCITCKRHGVISDLDLLDFSCIFKGIRRDVEKKALTIVFNEFFPYICKSPLRTHSTKRNRRKSFQYKMMTIFTESLVHEALFNTKLFFFVTLLHRGFSTCG